MAGKRTLMHFLRSVCIITVWKTVRNSLIHQDSLWKFGNIPQYILLYPKIFSTASTILHPSATFVQNRGPTRYFFQNGYRGFARFLKIVKHFSIFGVI